MLTPFDFLVIASVALCAWLAGRAAAHKRARRRTDVLSMVAHDLRNPLSLISSSSSLLLEQPELPAAQRERMLQMTQRAVGQMTRLTSDLLDATRMQGGELNLDLADVDTRAILLQVEETFEPSATEKQIALRLTIPDDAMLIHVDMGRVLQALGNLVGNALKFTRPGGEVRVTAARCGENVVFSVADTGSGMSPKDQRRVFDRFFQARAGDSRGVGLGLTITKGIVVAHGGRIWLRSEPGRGTTFFFSVPSVSVGKQLSPATFSAPTLRTGMLPQLRSPFRLNGLRLELDKCALQSITNDADSLARRALQPLRSVQPDSAWSAAPFNKWRAPR
jgi:signal transduction histidine kinase